VGVADNDEGISADWAYVHSSLTHACKHTIQDTLYIIPRYSLEIKFPQMILDSLHHEPDPAKADFHYVHVYMYHAFTASHFGMVWMGLWNLSL
jgi:hypothetical protein